MTSVDTGWSGNDPGVLKMEDVFQEEKSRDINRGPTLAALNFDFESTSTGFMEDSDSGLVGAGQAMTSQPNGLQTLQQQQQQNAILQARSLTPATPEEKKSVNKQKWNTTSLLSAFLTRPALRSFSSQTANTKATCTVSSPTACGEKIFSENNPADGRVECKLSPGGTEGFEVAGSFSLVPEMTSSSTAQTAQKVIIPAAAVALNGNTVQNTCTTPVPLMVVSNDLVETKSALADLLTQPTTQLCPLVPVSVKTELFPTGSSCQVQPILTPLTPVQTGAKPGTKRSNSPNDDGASNGSGGSMDRKWEEIKQFIYNDEMPNFPTGSHPAAITGSRTAAMTGHVTGQVTSEPLLKKVKTEPEGRIF